MGTLSNVDIIVMIFGAIMVIAAFVAVIMKSVVGSIVAVGAVGLLASVLYLLLGAPDVAMTEAAIGSGLTTVIFLYAVKKMKKEDLNDI